MKALILDTETTGTIAPWMADHADHFPRVVQFGAVLLDATMAEVSSVLVVVDPEVDIPEGASAIHGITNDVARELGVPERLAVGMFARLSKVADIVVAFNADFDLRIMRSAAHRQKVPLPPKPHRCVMEAAEPIMELPSTQRMIDAGLGDKFKRPKLSEAYLHFMGREMDGAHNALADARACAEIYRHLMTIGIWKEAA